MKIIKGHLDYLDQKTNVMFFLPSGNEGGSEEKKDRTFAVFTHGYTSDKSSILTWPLRLAEVGVPCALFDLPGHYLGNYSEVEDFGHFKDGAHELFFQAMTKLQNHFKNAYPEALLDCAHTKLVLGGHSLGALLSLKALAMKEFEGFTKCSVSVGLGMAPKGMVHLFDTPFYKSTLNVREQLVSPALAPDNVFPWIKEEKEHLEVFHQVIHLITGVDDLVVGNDGMERFKEALEKKGNQVTSDKPTKLPHHEPQLAASSIKKYLKSVGWI